MALTRRQFISRAGLATAGALFAPGIWKNPLVRRAMADTIGDRFFITLFLDGGNDGLNTVIPIDNGTIGTLRSFYEQARSASSSGGLRVPDTSLAATAIGNDINTTTPLALHPGLIGLKNLWDDGNLAVVQGCGYPDYNLSHDYSRRIWETATPAGIGNGWVGRYLAHNYSGSDIPAVNIRGEVAGDFIQSTTSVIAVNRLRDFEFPYDDEYSSDIAAKRACFNSLYSAAKLSAQTSLNYTGVAGKATLDATDVYPDLNAAYDDDLGTRKSWGDQYDALDTSTASRLREIAKVIYGVKSGVPGITARHFELANGGYDTHSDQGTLAGPHYDLHRELGDALELFLADMADIGIADKVLVMVFSEFSRRITQNDNGTDHGSQGPVFVIGGGVRGKLSAGLGIYGSHPDITDPDIYDENSYSDGNTRYSQAVGDTYRSTDLRDVYGTILTRWLGMDEAEVLSLVLTPDIGDPNLYWTIPNFNVGFLP